MTKKKRKYNSHMYVQCFLPPGMKYRSPLESLLFATLSNVSEDMIFKVKIYGYKRKKA